MKKTVFLTLLIAFSLVSFSQDETKIKKNELGLNLYRIIDLFNFNDLTTNSIYDLSYKRSIKNYWLRNTIGLKFQDRTNKKESIKDEYCHYDVKYKIGIEKQKELYKRWFMNYGCDIYMLYNYLYHEYETDNWIYKTENNSWGIGLSPVFGIRYNINNSISIGTETCFNLIYNNSEYKKKLLDSEGNININSDSNQTVSSTDISGSYVLPYTIFLNIRF